MSKRNSLNQRLRRNRPLMGVTVFALFFALLGTQINPAKIKAAPRASQTPETTQAVFTNSAPITIPSSGSASPYPSTITVSGLSGTIANTPGSVKVTLNNFSHTFPDDTGMVLVGPTGAAFNICDGPTSADGGQPASNVTFTLSDTGATAVPDEDPLVNGTTYKPGDYYNDNYTAPGPGTAYTSPPTFGSGTFSSVYGGTNPNGDWKLYIVDFLTGDSGSVSGGWTLEVSTGVAPPTVHPVMDFDGDGKSDDVVARNVGGAIVWYFLNGAGFSGINFGLAATDFIVPGDYDGDFKWDVAVWRNGNFYILQSSNGAFVTVPFGQAGDDPTTTQDFDGDGKADPTVTRNVGGTLTFYIQRSTAGFTGVAFGDGVNDVPVRGDFDGDGKADVSVYRTSPGLPANTLFSIPSGGGPLFARSFGNFATDYIVPADFDGDHKTDVAVWRGATASGDGVWYWLRSSDGAFNAVQFGITNVDAPVPGDYDGDGKTDQAVWREGASSVFYHLNSTAGVTGTAFGTTNDYPVGNFQVR
jgi:hypothetical protein